MTTLTNNIQQARACLENAERAEAIFRKVYDAMWQIISDQACRRYCHDCSNLVGDSALTRGDCAGNPSCCPRVKEGMK